MPPPTPPAPLSRLLAAALRYATLGWPVLPMHTPTGDGGCSCRPPSCDAIGKHPKLRRGLHDASLDAGQLRIWWRRWPAANVGVVTGAASGLVGLDVDGPAGAAALARLQLDHGPLPATRRQVTARGEHLLFAHPGWQLPNSSAQLGEGLDVRGDGGLLVVAPSLHASGHRYRWSTDPDRQEVAAMPDWLAGLLRPAEPPAARGDGQAFALPSGYATAALNAECDRIRATAPGGPGRSGRNDALNRAAFTLGTLVATGALTDHQVRAALTAAGVEAGLPPREAARTVASGLAAGAARPRVRR